MSYQKFFSVAIVIFAVMGLFLSGCSSYDIKKGSKSFTKAIDNASSKAVKEIVQSSFVSATSETIKEDPGEEEIMESEETKSVGSSDMILVGEMLYVLAGDKLKVYDFETDESYVAQSDAPIRAIAFHDNKIFAGGDKLYRLIDSVLEITDDQFESEITTLYSYGYNLMIGTKDGLYSKGLLEKENLFDGVEISAMTSDYTGLWVGTAGDGLYRWDGTEFKKRYLLRDETFFDIVNSLVYSHDHLYMGTPNGFHIHDGGRWTNLSYKDGLPSDNVIAVDASGWVVQVLSDNGLASYFKSELTETESLSEYEIVDVIRKNNDLILLTADFSVLQKFKSSIKELIPSESNSIIDELTITANEIDQL